MTLKIVRTIFFIIIGFAVGITGYHLWGDRFISEDQESEPPAYEATVDQNQTELFTHDARAEDSEEVATEITSQLNDQLNAQRQNVITKAVGVVSPAVVSVNVMKVESYYQRGSRYYDPFDMFSDFFRLYKTQVPVKSVGSGFIISRDGYILTNEHVVQNAVEIIVVMNNDGHEYKADIVGTDHLTDIALLKIDNKDCPSLAFGNSDDVLIGEWSIALGNPFGLFIKSQPTVTVGVISALHRDFSPVSERVYQDMIQTDAAINNGNSGGPLCNILGQVIGMNTFIYTGESGKSGNVGIGFAIPANRIKEVVNELKKYGKIERDVWIGFQVSDLTPYLARLVEFSRARGVVVVKLDKNSPAQKAGLQIGDVLLTVNSKEVATVNEAQAALLTADPKVGSVLELNVWRNGKEFNITIILEKQR